MKARVMAFYHYHAGIIKRSTGQSIVRIASYIAKAELIDKYTNIKYKYKANHLTKTYVLLPDYAPQEYKNMQILFDALNIAEQRRDAQMARCFDIALPIELNEDQQRELILSYVKEQFISQGQLAIVAIHTKKANITGRDNTPPRAGPIMDNPHAHVIVPFRCVDANGFKKTKTESRKNNNSEYLTKLRESWADKMNRMFERLGLETRVSAKSLYAQGIYREPSKYMNPISFEMERRGRRTRSGDFYREQIERVKKYTSREREIERSRSYKRSR